MGCRAQDRLPVVARLFAVPSLQVTVATVAIAAAVLAAFAHGQWQAHRQVVADAERSTRNVTHLVAQHASRTFDSVEATLQAVGRLRADAARGIYRSQQSIHVHLKTLHGGSPFLGEIGWHDAYGVRVASSLQLNPRRSSAADREFFAVHRDDPAHGMHVTAPVRSPEDGRWRFEFSIRLENLDGSFAGVAKGAIHSTEFADIYRGLDLGPGYAVALLRPDGSVLARAADSRANFGSLVGETASYPRHLASLASATYHSDAGRIGTFIAVPRTNQKLVVDVSVGRADALATYWRDLAWDGARVGISLVVLLAGGIAIATGLRRRELLQSELAAAVSREKAARTAAVEAEARVRHMQKMDAVGTLAGGIAHELNNALVPIISLSRRALKALHPGSREHENLELVVAAAARSRDLVRKILDFARKPSGAGSETDVLEAIRATVASVAATMPQHIKLNTMIAEDVGAARIDRDELEQVLVNLVTNAIQAISHRPGSVDIVATLDQDRMSRRGRAVRITVRDDGPGVADAVRDRVFEPFFTTKPVGQGTGLGLSLVHSIVTSHGGTVELDPAPEAGAAFHIRLEQVSGPINGGG